MSSIAAPKPLRLALGACVTFSLIVSAWWLATHRFGAPPTALPLPEDVVEALRIGWIDGALYGHLLATLTGAGVGLFAGAVCGLILGVAFAECDPLERALMPLVTAIQSTPKIAIAPLLIVYVGYGVASKIVIVGILCLFPMILSAFYGVRAAPKDLVDLYRAYDASWLMILWRVKLPAAAASLFAGLQLSVVLAISGAVVSEFIAAQAGLGFVIKSRMNDLDVSMMFACILSLAVIGALANGAVVLARRSFAFWLEK